MADPNATGAIGDDDRAIVAALPAGRSLPTFFPRENGPCWPPCFPSQAPTIGAKVSGISAGMGGEGGGEGGSERTGMVLIERPVEID